MESEFFGYEKGAFTGAINARKGRFAEAKGGTLFLGEVADLPASMQPKFLRAIQEQEGTRLGYNDVIPYDLRVISASNRSLRAKWQPGDFARISFIVCSPWRLWSRRCAKELPTSCRLRPLFCGTTADASAR